MAKADFNITDAWNKLGKMKYSDFYCAYQSTPSVAVKCAGLGCSKWGIRKDAFGEIVFVGCSDRLMFKSSF